MKLKEKPQYGIWRNVCFMVRVAWHTAKSVLAVCITAAIINVLLNLVQLYIAPEILVRVEQHTSLS